MSYVLTTMRSEDVEAVLADASEAQRHRILSRRFFEGSEHVWAVDRVADRYLLLAPKRGATSSAYEYFFRYADRLYEITAGSYGADPLLIHHAKSIDSLDAFKQELAEAFRVHRIYGSPENEPPFEPIFAEVN